jgi:hypothetical protein
MQLDRSPPERLRGESHSRSCVTDSIRLPGMIWRSIEWPKCRKRLAPGSALEVGSTDIEFGAAGGGPFWPRVAHTGCRKSSIFPCSIRQRRRLSESTIFGRSPAKVLEAVSQPETHDEPCSTRAGAVWMMGWSRKATRSSFESRRIHFFRTWSGIWLALKSLSGAVTPRPA